MGSLQSLPILRGIALLLLLTWGSAESRADEITFKIAIYPNAASNGAIWMKTPERPWHEVYAVPPQGTLKVTLACGTGTYFQARISDGYQPFDRTYAQKSCAAGEIPFLFRKTLLAVIEPAQSGEALIGIEVSDQIKILQGTLTQALAVDDSEMILKSSSQIYNYLVETGNHQVAEPYRVLNLNKAKAALGGGELTFDTSQSRYVLSESDEAMIKKIQAENNLKPSGKLDWMTMESIARFRL